MPAQVVASATVVGQLNGSGGSLGTIGYLSYREELEWPTRANEYQAGWVQQKNLATGYRRKYTCTVRLSASKAATFKSFFDSHGKTVPFQFQPLREGSLKIVRFDSGFQNSVTLGTRVVSGVDDPGMVEISFTLVEVQ